LTAGDAPRQTTVSNLFDDALTGGTYTNLNLAGALTFGTATGNRTVSTSATITTGTIPNLTAGTTTSTAATITNGTITNGTITTALIPTLTAGTRVAVLNTAQQYSRAHNFAATALTITSGTVPWDLSQNQVATLTVTTNSTMNTPTNPQAGSTYVMIVTQGTGGSNTLSFSTAYKFPSGTVPSLSTGSSQVDVLSFVSNGTVLYGVSSQNFS